MGFKRNTTTTAYLGGAGENQDDLPDTNVPDLLIATTEVPKRFKTIPNSAGTQSDWEATSGDAEILNKPTIPDAQVPSDWTSTTDPTQILNKPSILEPSYMFAHSTAAAIISKPHSSSWVTHPLTPQTSSGIVWSTNTNRAEISSAGTYKVDWHANWEWPVGSTVSNPIYHSYGGRILHNYGFQTIYHGHQEVYNNKITCVSGTAIIVCGDFDTVEFQVKGRYQNANGFSVRTRNAQFTIVKISDNT